MAGANLWLPGIWPCLARMSAFLLWFSLLALVDAQNRSVDEVQVLTDFRDLIEVKDETRSEPLNGPTGLAQPRGYWSSWRATDANPCAWVGVSCTANSTVAYIDLSGWGLNRLVSGSLRTLSRLPDLRQLDLSSNEFSVNSPTAIPEDVGNLTRLTRLDLSRSNLQGVIPPNITNCRSLRYLYLGENQLEGSIPNLSGMVRLQVLSLAENRLTGTFPTELEQIQSLVSVDLSGNQLSGTIPSFANLTNLLELNLDNNNFTDFENPEVPIASSLQHLFVSGNQLGGGIPFGMTQMPSLEVLNMSSNQFTGGIPSGLARQTNHSFWLDLSQNQLSGEIPGDLFQPSPPNAVAALNLSHNRLTGAIPIPLDGGDRRFLYEVLDLSNNQLSGPIPLFSKNRSSQFYSLCLQNNNLEGDIVDLLTYGDPTNDSSSGTLNSKEIRLNGNLFTGDLSRMARNWSSLLPVLQVVDLSNNELQMSTTKDLPDPLRSTLESLVGGSPGLREFRVGGNRFAGTSLPAAYLSRTNLALEVLDFSNNQLQGEISGKVFNSTWLPTLQTLNLSSNKVTGNIPESTILLPNLAVLDVANNNLSGVLPPIPRNSTLSNPRFFEGNSLCGDPLAPCRSAAETVNGIRWWILVAGIGGSVLVGLLSCMFATWRWRVYKKKHEQDADLIRTLMERETATLMPLRDLRKATDNFAESSQIGEGGFGTVYTGKLADGTRVAIKRSKREGSEKDKEQFLNEVRILSQVNHRNLVKLLGCCMENKVALLVFEFVSNGTLQEHLHGKIDGARRLSWKQRLNIAVQTADALNYLHSATTYPIYHRDVKSANILLTEELNAKVADFGISKLAPVEATHVSTVAVQGTIGYIDPEYYTSYQLTAKSDVYSLGVVLLELISAKPAIDFQRGGDATGLVYFASTLIQSGDLQELIDPALAATYRDPRAKESMMKLGRLAMQCLDMRSRARPTMNEVLVEIQTLCLEFDGSSGVDLVSIDDRQRNNYLGGDRMVHPTEYNTFTAPQPR